MLAINRFSDTFYLVSPRFYGIQQPKLVFHRRKGVDQQQRRPEQRNPRHGLLRLLPIVISSVISTLTGFSHLLKGTFA